MKNENVLLRLIVFPAILTMIMLTFIYGAFVRSIQFLRYGGEFINYEKDTKSTIKDIFDHLKINN